MAKLTPTKRQYINDNHYQAAGELVKRVFIDPDAYIKQAMKAGFIDLMADSFIRFLRANYKYDAVPFNKIDLFGYQVAAEDAVRLSNEALAKQVNYLLCHIMDRPDNKEQELNITLAQFYDYLVKKYRLEFRTTSLLNKSESRFDEFRPLLNSMHTIAQELLKSGDYDLIKALVTGFTPTSRFFNCDLFDCLLKYWSPCCKSGVTYEVNKACLKALDEYFNKELLKARVKLDKLS